MSSAKEAASKTKMDEVIKMASSVLDEQASNYINKKILKGCKGVAIIECDEMGVVVTGGMGGGVVMKRNDDGSFGPPAGIYFSEIGLGVSMGVAKKYILLFPMTEKGLQDLTSNRVKLGGQVGIAAGPLGRETDLAVVAGIQPTYSYIVEKGAWLSVAVTTSWIDQAKEGNNAFYGADVSPTDIVMKPGAVTIPEGKGVEELHAKLAQMCGQE